MEKRRYTAHVAQTHPMTGPMQCSEWKIGPCRSRIVTGWIAKIVALFRHIMTSPSATGITCWVEESPCETET